MIRNRDDWSFGTAEESPINQAINTARGAAAIALAQLLFADRSRWRAFSRLPLVNSWWTEC